MLTPSQIKYIESMMIDLGIWDKRAAWYKNITEKENLSDMEHEDAQKLIPELKRMLRDKKDREENLMFNFKEIDE